MASFLGSNFGFEFGAKICLFWSLWQVIPDWLVLEATGCEQSELSLLCCGSTSMIPAAKLWNKFLATGCSMMVYPWVDTCCLLVLGFKTMHRNCRGNYKCFQSCWGLELTTWLGHPGNHGNSNTPAITTIWFVSHPKVKSFPDEYKFMYTSILYCWCVGNFVISRVAQPGGEAPHLEDKKIMFGND